MFDLERFIDDCKHAANSDRSHQAVNELVKEAVSNPGDVIKGLGEPTRAGVQNLYQSDNLTILNLVWGPGMELYPHDHRMWAVIGLYGGREDNYFYKRHDDSVRQHGTRAAVLEPGDVAPLAEDVIHAVKNPLQQLTGALHVYGGDFFETPRSEWDPETLTERPYSVEGIKALFEASNALLDQQ